MILFITRQGVQVRLSQGRIAVYERGTLLSQVPREQVRQIVAFGNIHFTTPLISWALGRKVPIFFLSQSGKIKGHLSSPSWTTPALRRKLYVLSLKPSLRLAFARKFVTGKIANCRTFLEMVSRQNGADFSGEIRHLTLFIKQAKAASSIEELRAVEARAAKTYYATFPRVFGWPFQGRRKHPPEDELNSLLSLGYSLLYTTLTSFLWAFDLDPAIGLYHRPRSGFYPLSADLMEIFRAPVVDLVVYRAIRKGWIQRGDFELDHRKGYFLVPEKLRLFLHLYRRRLEKYDMTWNRKISSTVRDLVKSIRILKPEFEGVRWR